MKIDAGDRELLAETNLTISAGKITVIVGGSGAGKSVLLRTLAGLTPRNGPVIKWKGQIESGHHLQTTHPKGPEKADQTTTGTSANTSEPEIVFPEQPRIGIVFQQFALFDELSPTENVQFAIDHRNDRAIAPSHTSR